MAEERLRKWPPDFQERAKRVVLAAKCASDILGKTHFIFPIIDQENNEGITYRAYGLPNNDIIQNLNISLVIKRVRAEDEFVREELFNMTGSMLQDGEDMIVELGDIAYSCAGESKLMRRPALEAMARHLQDVAVHYWVVNLNQSTVEYNNGNET